MEERGLRHNYIFTFIKLFLFLILFCFLLELTRAFVLEAKSCDGFSTIALFSSVFFSFFFYYFIADLNSPYKNIQMFFFRSPFISYLFPFLLLVVSAIYFILPRAFGFDFDRNFFVFLGGFVFTVHMIYIAHETKGRTFTESVNYFFTLSILYIFNVILLGLYLKIAFKFRLSDVIIDGIKNGTLLIRSLFVKTL